MLMDSASGLEFDLPEALNGGVLACGSQARNRVCLTKNHRAYLSNEVNDLADYNDYLTFEKNIGELQNRLNMRPALIAYDLHPEYLSTKYARTLEGAIKIGVQHHHAHLVATMIEYGLEEKVIGITFDGTGFGTDGCLWGGEFLVADLSSFERKAHLAYHPMPGGSNAVWEPYRMAVSYLYKAFGYDMFHLDIEFIKFFESEQLQRIITLLEKNINSPLSSSSGRLFDAVSSLLRLKDRIEYEGEAAMALEREIYSLGSRIDDAVYRWNFKEEKDLIEIDTDVMIEDIVHDLVMKRKAGLISARFHNTLADIIREMALLISSREGYDRVILSGGVFNNRYLLDRAQRLLTAEGFKVYVNKKLPFGDGNIALGQAVIAAMSQDSCSTSLADRVR
jgi:hydrogenase maturation protein HypF